MLRSINHRCGTGQYEDAVLRVFLNCGFWEYKLGILGCHSALHHQIQFNMNYLILPQSNFLLLKKNGKSFYLLYASDPETLQKSLSDVFSLLNISFHILPFVA